MAAIHARELSTSELALRFVDHLLESYGVDGDATWLLDEHLIVVVPVANPDGRVLAEQGYLQRKNTDTSHGSCAVPRIGVDLNRNADFKWGVVNKPTESPCGETYPGPVPASEPEITALQSLVRSLFADQRGPNDTDAAPITTTGILLTIHSYSNLVLCPGAGRIPRPPMRLRSRPSAGSSPRTMGTPPSNPSSSIPPRARRMTGPMASSGSRPSP